MRRFGSQSTPTIGVTKEDPPADVPDVASGPSSGLVNGDSAERAERREKQERNMWKRSETQKKGCITKMLMTKG